MADNVLNFRGPPRRPTPGTEDDGRSEEVDTIVDWLSDKGSRGEVEAIAMAVILKDGGMGHMVCCPTRGTAHEVHSLLNLAAMEIAFSLLNPGDDSDEA